jgi:cytochrome c oxidase subunit 2
VSSRSPGPVHILPGLVGRPPYKTRRRRALAGAVGVALLAALVLAPTASAGWFLPESGGSPNADAIRTMYILVAVLALVIFIGVEGLLIYSLIRFRARKGRAAAQIHGNTQLEIGWTVGAFVLLIFITVFTFALLDDVTNPAASEIDANGNPVAANVQYAQTNRPGPPAGSASMNIVVVGQQYVWSYAYPGEERLLAYTDMYVPVGMTITLDIQSVDVVHSWWIPKLGGKADAIPGYTNKSWFQIPLDAIPEGEDRVVFDGQCAELCGRNHADMLGRVIGLRYDDWRAWYERKVEEVQAARDEAAEEREQLESSEGQGER